ncbi:hypothetical protein LguiA_011171 [Lonicera macranthoides]
MGNESNDIEREVMKNVKDSADIVVLEENKKEVPEKAEDESSPSKTNQSMTRETSETDDIFDKTDIDNLFNEDVQVTVLSLLTFHNNSPDQLVIFMLSLCSW